MNTLTRTIPLCFLVILFGAGSSSAATTVLFDANFDTDGDFQGFVDFQSRLSSFSVASGSASGTGGANNDPQLRTASGTLAIDLANLSNATLEIRLRNSTGVGFSGGLSFREFSGAGAGNVGGLPVTNFSFTPAAANTFEIFTLDAKTLLAGVSDFAPFTNDNILRSIRLDPMNGSASDPVSGVTFDIDYVRVTTVTAIPEPGSAIALLGVAGFGLMARRRRARAA